MASLFLVLLITAQRPGACFLLIPPSAKATGMAYAWTAIADDASANYYNAAGLAVLERPSVTVSYFKVLPGLHEGMPYFYIGAAYPFNNQTVGFHVSYFSPGECQYADGDGFPVGPYTVYRMAMGPSYARKIFNCLSLGLGVKLINEHFFTDWIIERMPELGIDQGGTGISYAFDFNFLYKIKPFLSVGLIFHNLGPKITYTQSGSSDPLPLLSRLGLACKPLDMGNISITLSTEMTKVLVGMGVYSDSSFWEDIKYEFKEAWKAIGLEVKYYRMLSLRTGYFYDYEGQRIGWTFGGGIKVLNLEIDVGIDEDVFDFETRNRKLSLTYTF